MKNVATCEEHCYVRKTLLRVKNVHTERRKVENGKVTDLDQLGSNHETQQDPLIHQLQIHHPPARHHRFYLSEKVTLSSEYYTRTLTISENQII